MGLILLHQRSSRGVADQGQNVSKRRRKLFQFEVCVHKILIVDDDKATCDLLRSCLSEGYEVVDTQDPEQVLGLALEHKPDAILLDLMMPKFSGFELCQSFRSLSYTSTIPVLVITGETGRNLNSPYPYCRQP